MSAVARSAFRLFHLTPSWHREVRLSAEIAVPDTTTMAETAAEEVGPRPGLFGHMLSAAAAAGDVGIGHFYIRRR